MSDRELISFLRIHFLPNVERLVQTVERSYADYQVLRNLCEEYPVAIPTEVVRTIIHEKGLRVEGTADAV